MEAKTWSDIMGHIFTSPDDGDGERMMPRADYVPEFLQYIAISMAW